MPPMSHTPPHAAPHAGVVGSTAREESYRGKNRPACPRTVFGPSPTTRCAYVWPRPGGSCRCTKRGVHFLYPYYCARAVRATGTTTPSTTREVSQGKAEVQENWSNAKTKTTKSKGDEVDSPGKILAGGQF